MLVNICAFASFCICVGVYLLTLQERDVKTGNFYVLEKRGLDELGYIE